MIVKGTTILSRTTVKPGYLPNCKRFVFDYSSVNQIEMILKPFNGKVLEDYTVRFS